MLWEVDILPKDDPLASDVADEAAELGIGDGIEVRAARGYLLEGQLAAEDALRIGIELLADPVVEHVRVGTVDDPALADDGKSSRLIHVLPRRGVTDAVAESALKLLGQMNLDVSAVRTLRKYWVEGLTDNQLQRLCEKVLANDSIEQVVLGPLAITELGASIDYEFAKVVVPIGELDDEGLMRVSREGTLSLSIEEMQTIQAHFAAVGRDPTDVELETIAQTWSEHCSHKTLAGRIAYRDENGERHFENMLKETIFAATAADPADAGAATIGASASSRTTPASSGSTTSTTWSSRSKRTTIPRRLEPYGGANTGIGGVIRDPLGTGLGAKPICNTDVFLLRPARHAGRCSSRRACCIRAA